MVASEKELGISEEHSGIIILDDDAPVGVPLVDYMGDAVLDISILPNMARNANVLGVARELSALTGRPLGKPMIEYKTDGKPVNDLVSIEITEPELNPRFVIGLIRDVEIKPSPYQIQRRLRLAGIRPINNIVDATNYAMLDIGEPLHAFDYDVLKARAGNKNVKIITRPAKDGERLTTLDGVRKLTSANVLVCDDRGALSLAGVMGGSESEVYDASQEVLDAKGPEMQSDQMHRVKASVRGVSTANILLEGAAWNFINIRKTAKQHNLPSEASFRFSRGVHPAMAEQGVRRGLQLMAQWSGGRIAPGLVDEYPLKPVDPTVTVTPKDVKRWIGIDLTAQKIADLLTYLEFECTVDGILSTQRHRRIVSISAKGSSGSQMSLRRWRAAMAMTASRKHAWLTPSRLSLATRSMNGRNTSGISLSPLDCRRSSRIVSPRLNVRAGLSIMINMWNLPIPLHPSAA